MPHTHTVPSLPLATLSSSSLSSLSLSLSLSLSSSFIIFFRRRRSSSSLSRVLRPFPKIRCNLKKSLNVSGGKVFKTIPKTFVSFPAAQKVGVNTITVFVVISVASASCRATRGFSGVEAGRDDCGQSVRKRSNQTHEARSLEKLPDGPPENYKDFASSPCTHTGL